MTGKHLVSPDVEKRIWGEEGFRVFLSHKNEVKSETGSLKRQLKFYGVSCFVAHEDIEPTQAWQDEIENALSSMDTLVALMTVDFHDSNWTDQEIGFAMGREVPIISLRLGRDPYGFIGKFQALSCSWDSATIKLIEIFLKHDRTLNAYTDAYIKAVKKCQSFDDANSLSKILPNITKLSNQQTSGLISAFNENDQVHWSHGWRGDKPGTYGKGLVFHLNRLLDKKYELSDLGKIEAKQ